MKRLSLTLVVLTCLAGFVNADMGGLGSIQTWFLHLKQGLSDSAVRSRYQTHRGATAVAAVRGAKQDAADADHPQWETMTKAQREALKKERLEFAADVDLALSGKVAQAGAGFDAFEKAHPKSRYLADVRQARERLKGLSAAPAAGQPKP